MSGDFDAIRTIGVSTGLGFRQPSVPDPTVALDGRAVDKRGDLGGTVAAGDLQDIETLGASLWAAADNRRANSKLTSTEYCIPVLGLIFLRHASNRYATACRQI